MAVTLNASSTAGFVTTADTSTILQLQTNGTTAVTVDASQNVGVGTTSPSASYKVDVVGLIRSNTTTSGGGQYTVAKSGSTVGGLSGSGNWLGTSATDLAIWAETGNALAFFSNGSATERMRVTTAGYVTKPNQPAFQVNGVSLNGLVYIGGTTNLNVGSHFNTSTGIFTAPVAGNYLFSFALTIGDGNSQFINIYKNGSLFAGNILQYTSTFTTGSQTLIIPMSSGDTANAQIRDASYNIYNARFCGYLLG